MMGLNQQIGQEIDLGNHGEKIKFLEDGTSVYLGKQYPVSLRNGSDAGFYENLVEELDPFELDQIGSTLSDLIESDIDSQKPYRQGLADVIKLLGLSLDNAGSTDGGTINVVSTTLFETVCHIVASASNSLLPAQNMAKTVIFGEITEQTAQVAKRLEYYYDYYFQEKLKHFRAEQLRTFMWACVAGCVYKKVLIDPYHNRPDSLFIRPGDFVINKAYSTHLSCPRRTEIKRMTKREYDYLVSTGFYTDNAFYSENVNSSETGHEIQTELDSISGIQPNVSSDEYDRNYVLYESHVHFLIKSDREKNRYNYVSPYIITLDSQTKKIVRICRNWRKEDITREEIQFYVDYNLLPSLEGDGYGMMHYAADSAEAATAMKRLILKATTYASFPGGIYDAGVRLESNSISPMPGQYVPLNLGGRKASEVLETLPFRDASDVAIQFQKEIEQTIRNPSDIINDTIAEMAPSAPTGSVLAILETLQRVPNLILQGFHSSFSLELQLFQQRFYEWFSPTESYPFLVPGGEHALMKEDFGPKYKVMASSDPTMQNSAYRLMLSELVLGKALESPDLHDLRESYLYFYKNLGLSQEKIDKILLPKPKQLEMKPIDPATENADLINGKGAKAFMFQDHSAHMTVHDIILQDPNQDPGVIAVTQAHKKEHEGMQFLVELQARMNTPIPENVSDLQPQEQNQLAILQAQTVQQMQNADAEQNPAPEAPIDPGRAQIQDAEIKAQTARENLQFDMQKLEIDVQLKESQRDFEMQKVQLETEIKHRELDLKAQEAESRQLQATHAMQIKELELQYKMKIDDLKNQLADKKMQLDQINKEKDFELNSIKAGHDMANQQNQFVEQQD